MKGGFSCGDIWHHNKTHRNIQSENICPDGSLTREKETGSPGRERMSSCLLINKLQRLHSCWIN